MNDKEIEQLAQKRFPRQHPSIQGCNEFGFIEGAKAIQSALTNHKVGATWINGRTRLPDIDYDDEPKKYVVRVYGDDPHSGCIYVGHETAEQMKNLEKEEDGYYEWLDESPQEIKQVGEEEIEKLAEKESLIEYPEERFGWIANGLRKLFVKTFIKGYKAALNTYSADGWISLADEFVEFALNTFNTATPLSSLKKLSEEIQEVAVEINHGHQNLAEEYVDCIMCIYDSAARMNITPSELKTAFAEKLKVNKARKWIKNDDDTYSHVKPPLTDGLKEK